MELVLTVAMARQALYQLSTVLDVLIRFAMRAIRVINPVVSATKRAAPNVKPEEGCASPASNQFVRVVLPTQTCITVMAVLNLIVLLVVQLNIALVATLVIAKIVFTITKRNVRTLRGLLKRMNTFRIWE
jgi:hypothetical protein